MNSRYVWYGALSFVFGLVVMSSSVVWASQIGPNPDMQWEGSFNYAIVGGTVLEDTCAPSLTLDCDPALRDQQGDRVSDWPNLTEMYGVPGDATIEQVFLVWMGSASPNAAIDTNVSFQPPAGDPYDVVANPNTDCEIDQYRQQIGLGGDEYDFKYFTCWVDITEQLKEHVEVNRKPINGLWSFGHLMVGLDTQYIKTTGVLGAWAVLIVYQSPSIARKRVYLYKGFQRAQCSQIILNPSGFEVPANPQAKITFMVGEGDAGLFGTGTCGTYSETLMFNGQILTDACNPDGNQYNSTRNTNISVNPCLTDVYSVDLDTYQLGNLNVLHEGDTSAQVIMQLGQDQIFTNFIMLSIDTKLPSFDIPGKPEKTCSVEDGGYVSPGDEFEYYIRVENWGEDVAHGVTVKDEVPQYTEYVCGSTYICGPADSIQCDPNGSSWIQIPDNGNCGFPLAGNGYMVANELPVGGYAGYTIKFKVRLLGEEAGVNKETIIYNDAYISSSDQGEAYVTNGGIPVRLNVQTRSYEGTLSIEQGEHDPRGGFLYAGQSNIPIAQLKLTVKDGFIKLKGISFKAEGTLNDATDVRDARLYIDDGDGVVTPNDTLVGSDTFSRDDGTIDFSGINKVMNDGDLMYLLLVYDMADNLVPGSQFNLVIERRMSVDMHGGLNDYNLPYRTGTFVVPSKDLLVYAGRNMPVGGEIQPGPNVPMLQVAMRSASGANYSLKSVQIENSGNLSDNYFDVVTLVLDANGDGLPDGDTALGTCTLSEKKCTISSLDVQVGANETNLLVSASIKQTAGNYRTLKFGITGMEFLSNGSPAEAEGLPVWGDEFMIMRQQTDGDFDSTDGIDNGTDNPYNGGDYNNGTGTEEEKKSSDDGCASSSMQYSLLMLLLLLFVSRLHRRNEHV